MLSPRTFLLALVLCVLTFAPVSAFAADANFFGPIIPEECHCEGSAPDWGCVLAIVQNGINFIVSMGVVIFTLAVAYAGAMYMASGSNPGQHKEAVKYIQNLLLGLLTLLSAWLLVDFVMKVLYNPDAGGFGPWTSILSDGDEKFCLEVSEGPAQVPGGEEPTVPGEEDPGEEPDVSPENVTVTVNEGVVVSSTAVNVLKDILADAGLTRATITSGRRTPADQARIMYDNIVRLGVANQKSLYGPAGDQVIEVYEQQRAAGASVSQIRNAMQAKIEQLGCGNVSNHCSQSDVFDVAPSSISDGAAFRRAIQESSAVRHYIFPPTDPAYHIEL